MKRILSLFLLLFLTFSTVGFTEEGELTDKEFFKIIKCLGLSDDIIAEVKKKNGPAALAFVKKMLAKLDYMEKHPAFRKKNRECYQLLKKAQIIFYSTLDFDLEY